MLHKISIASALLSILYMVYTSTSKGYIFRPAILIMIVSAIVYYVTTSVVTSAMVNKKEGKKRTSFRAGLVDKNNLIPGRLEFDGEKIAFYKRKGDFGGVIPSFILSIQDLKSYSIGSINEYHKGIRITAVDGTQYEIKCKEILQKEDLFLKETALELSDDEDEEQ